MTTVVSESVVEEAALQWLEGLGYAVAFGPDIAPGGPAAERSTYEEVVLTGRLRDAIHRLNPSIPPEAREDALRNVTRPESPSLVLNNRSFHKMLTDGVEVEYRTPDGRIVATASGWRISTTRLKTTGWLSTSSPWWRPKENAAQI